MLIAFWIIAGVTAVAFVAAGLIKLGRRHEDLKSSMAWVEGFSPIIVKLIGLAEVLGALGLVLPALLHIAPILSPIAGFALAALMIGAASVHVRRKERPVPPIVLGLLAVISAVLAIASVI